MTIISTRGGANYRTALFHFFTLCAVANVPLSWSKTAGGDVVSWVGFELTTQNSNAWDHAKTGRLADEVVA